MKQDFRDAMARLSAAVNIITTDGPAGRAAMTVSAVSSVSDEPATVLVCINVSSAAHPILVGNGRLCINILAAHHEDVARIIAGMTGLAAEERMAQVRWEMGDYGQPVLPDALAVLEGDIVLQQQAGTHSVLFVEIRHIRLAAAQADGLAYFGRRFHRIAAGVPVAA
ncbi:flavin reductase [Herbaspirillum seropedicae]|uniref:flavin reductase n=1 Tax=Herbaspirillum seropedicae TaxID=964 RepID=UPI000847F10C|nr:flavin reductase [Herbaspirillum seropedicae]AON53825.1 4-hydroxyphenylacetate 3-monooxygenase small subunit [Herbaspirillum seropedicae]